MTIETQRVETGTANSGKDTDARQKLSDEFGASLRKTPTTPESKSLQDKSTGGPGASDEMKTVSNAEQSKALPNLSIVHDGTKTETANAVSNDGRDMLKDLRTKFKDAVINRDPAAADTAAQQIKDETQKQIQQISQAKLALNKSLADRLRKRLLRLIRTRKRRWQLNSTSRKKRKMQSI